MNKVILDTVRFWERAYTYHLLRYLSTRDYDRQLKKSGVDTQMIWGFMEEYCFVQGMLNAKVTWTQDIFENMCFQCPMTQWCKFRKLVK